MATATSRSTGRRRRTVRHTGVSRPRRDAIRAPRASTRGGGGRRGVRPRRGRPRRHTARAPSNSAGGDASAASRDGASRANRDDDPTRDASPDGVHPRCSATASLPPVIQRPRGQGSTWTSGFSLSGTRGFPRIHLWFNEPILLTHGEPLMSGECRDRSSGLKLRNIWRVLDDISGTAAVAVPPE